VVGGALKSAKLGASFKGAEDKFFRRPEPKDVAARGCVKGAHVEYMVGGIVENLTPRSRPLALVTWEGVMG